MHLIDHRVVRRAVHVRQILLRLVVEGDAERVDAAPFHFEQSVPGILDAVLTLVTAVILGPPVRQCDQQFGASAGQMEQMTEMADRHAHARVGLRSDPTDPLPHL